MIRKAIAITIIGVLGGLPVGVPILDRDLVREHPVVEAHHHPGACVRSHDHTLCTAWGSLRVASHSRPIAHVPEEVRLLLRTPVDVATLARLDLASPHPRAPPLA
ncbi:MAG: hypothetical protein HY704_04625 [Gemmatimonadetes bacterium]|nr:hypothetical protein [Gemmatimonadota bacterium]